MEDDLAFDWDKANIDHIGAHGIAPNESAQIFGNEANDLRYEVKDGEERWTSIGHTDALRILVVVWTMRGESLRIVTAFDAGKRLAGEYFKNRGL